MHLKDISIEVGQKIKDKLIKTLVNIDSCNNA